MSRTEQETTFTRQEIMAGAKVAFGVRPEIMAGALALKPDQDSFGKEEAYELIVRFRSREVVG